MFERFTDRARRVVVLAQEEARALSAPTVAAVHFLLGALTEGEGVAALALGDLGVTLDAARGHAHRYPSSDLPGGQIPFDQSGKRVCELALREALQLGHSYIGTEHLLLAVDRMSDGDSAALLAACGVPGLADMRAAVMKRLGLYEPPAEKVPVSSPPGRLALIGQVQDALTRAQGLLDTLRDTEGIV